MNPLNGVLVGSGSGAGSGTGDVVGPGSSTAGNLAEFGDTTGALLADSGVVADNVTTAAAAGVDNVVPRWDGASKALQNSAVQIGDVAGNSVPVSSTAGNALALAATAPAATTGASQAGVNASLAASDAVASTDTAGAAAGGSVTITAGAAARNASGNAASGGITLLTPAGIGTGLSSGVTIQTSGSSAGSGTNGIPLRVLTDNSYDISTNIDIGNQSYIHARIGSAPESPSAADINFWNRTGSTLTKIWAITSAGVARLSSTGVYAWCSGTVAATSADTGISRVAAGQVAATNLTNGMANNIKIATTTVNASGATSTATGLVPAGCILLGVTSRVVTAITSGDGGASVDIGDGTIANAYADDVAFTLGTTTALADHQESPIRFVPSAENVVFTCNGGTFSGGTWRVCAHYLDLTAPTS